MKQKKSYLIPKIKAVQLDSSAAILQTCKTGYTGSAMFSGATGCMYVTGLGGNTLNCSQNPKGTPMSPTSVSSLASSNDQPS